MVNTKIIRKRFRDSLPVTAAVLIALFPLAGGLGSVIPEYPFIALLAAINLFLLCSPFSPKAVTWPDLLFAAWVLWGITKVSFGGTPADPLYLSSSLYLIILYPCLRCGSAGSADTLLKALVWSGILQALIAVLQLMRLSESNHSFFNITGSFGNPGPLAGYLVPLFFLSLYLARSPSARWKIIYYAATLLIASIVIAAFSRAAWAAAAVAGLFLFKENIAAYLKSTPKWVAAGMSALVVAICLAGAAWMWQLKKESATGRLLVWEITWKQAKKSILTGYGVNSFTPNYLYWQAEYLSEHKTDPERLLRADNTEYAFCEPLKILTERGVIGLTLATGFCLAVLLPFFRRSEKKEDKPRARYLASALLSLCVFGCFSYPDSVPPLRLLFVTLCALLISSYSYTPAFKPCKTILLKTGLVICLMIRSGSDLNTLKSYLEARPEILHLISGGSHAESVKTESLHNRLKNNPAWTLFYGGLLYLREDYRNALPVLLQAAALQPSSFLFGDIAECYFQTGDFKNAEHWFKLGTAATPAYITPHYRLFSFYKQTGRLPEATRVARYIIRTDFKVCNSITLAARKQADEYLKNTEQTNP